MFEELRIEYLADHRECIPILAGWHCQQWPALADPSAVADRGKRLLYEARRGGLPLSLVALIKDDVVGSVSLGHDLVPSDAGLLARVTLVWVAPLYRRFGVGSQLVRAAMAEARTLGLRRVQVSVNGTAHLFARLGWVTRSGSPPRRGRRVMMEVDLDRASVTAGRTLG